VGFKGDIFMSFRNGAEPDRDKVAQIEAQDLNIYDPTQTLKHYNRMARQFERAAEAAHVAADWEATMEGVHIQEARHEINEVMMDLAFGMSEGGGLKMVVERAIRNGRALNEEGVRRIAQELLAPGAEVEPELVLTTSVAGEKHMELQAYRNMLRLVEIYSASIMCRMEKTAADMTMQTQSYFMPRNMALNEVCRQIDRDIEYLTHYDPDTRPLNGMDYKPL
jgi:hypothetical protein